MSDSKTSTEKSKLLVMLFNMECIKCCNFKQTIRIARKRFFCIYSWGGGLSRRLCPYYLVGLLVRDPFWVLLQPLRNLSSNYWRITRNPFFSTDPRRPQTSVQQQRAALRSNYVSFLFLSQYQLEYTRLWPITDRTPYLDSWQACLSHRGQRNDLLSCGISLL